MANKRDLSAKMKETVQVMKAHGKLIRYNYGFWSWCGVEIDTHNVPIWYCDVRTLRGLEKREVVILDEENRFCQLI